MIVRRQVLMRIDFTSPLIISCLFCIGVVSTALAFIMWNKGLQLTSASISGLFYVIQPIVGTLLGWLLLQEQLTWGFLLGTVLIIGSVWLVTRFDV